MFDTEHLTSDLRGRAVRGGAVTMISQAAKFAFQIGSTVVLARLISPAEFGLIAMVVAVTGFIALFKDAGLSMATVQREKITHEQISTLFWFNVGLSVALAALTVLVAPLIARFYGAPRAASITMAISGVFIFGGLTIQHQALLRRQMRFGTLAAIELTSIAVGIATAIGCAFAGLGFWSLVFMRLAEAVSTAALTLTLCPWRPGVPSRGVGVRSMLAFGGNLTGFTVLNYFATNIDKVLLGRIWGGVSVGLYNKAYGLLLLPITQANAPISSVAIPALSRVADSPDRYRSAYMRICEKLMIVTMPGVAFMIVTADWLVELVLGPQWTEASRLFFMMGFAGLVQPALNSTGWLFISQNRTRDMLHWGVVDAVIKITAVAIGLAWGPMGVAMAVSVRIYIQTPILFWYVGRTGPVKARDLYRVLWAPGCASVFGMCAVAAMRRSFPELIGIAGLGAAFIVIAAITLLCLAIIPSGRSAMRDARISLGSLMHKEAR